MAKTPARRAASASEPANHRADAAQAFMAAWAPHHGIAAAAFTRADAEALVAAIDAAAKAGS